MLCSGCLDSENLRGPVEGLLKAWFILCRNANARAGGQEKVEMVRARGFRYCYGPSPRLVKDAETQKLLTDPIKCLSKSCSYAVMTTPVLIGMRGGRELYVRGGLGPPVVLSNALQWMPRFQIPAQVP